ncbi:PRD domain-containing protein [Vibrio panuliri]|uniref:PRD domain-containing protein n=1 Tax=Vibrio panuliri TaxID=1381081 RepID=A0A1Q9HQ87_9VIBR|nr:PRD domain-containing protein [Vibrio panuliri]KAB1457907.1 PRD domain-containing protein [Vibrio panuliri]OLQ93031.1 hypothetical protein BIY22_00630 [Vibrio panuliri]OLQ95607.1 hypothetical protein BIY20_06075 [Vibrio panuliri]
MEERLELLLQANVISSKAQQGCLRVIDIIDKQLSVPHDNEQYQMAITHLARAADRIWQNEAVAEGLDQDILDEISTDECYSDTLTLHQQVLDAMELHTVPSSEEGFMLANIYSLIQTSLEETK